MRTGTDPVRRDFGTDFLSIVPTTMGDSGHGPSGPSGTRSRRRPLPGDHRAVQPRLTERTATAARLPRAATPSATTIGPTGCCIATGASVAFAGMQAWVDDPGGSDDADVQGFSYPGVPDLPESWVLAGNAFVAIRTRLGSIDGSHPSHNARHRQMIDVKETRHGPFHEQGIATDRSAAGLSSREERSAVWMTWPVRSRGRRACMMPCWTIDCGGGLHLCRTICVFLDVESH